MKTVEKADWVKFQELAKNQGEQVVVVQGLGFVGSAVAAILADAQLDGKRLYQVIGLELDNDSGREKVGKINTGKMPFASPDESLETMLAGAREAGNLVATTDKECLRIADITLMNIHLDVENIDAEDANTINVNTAPYAKAARDIFERAQPECLLIVESTVPPGTIEMLINPLAIDIFNKRNIKQKPLIAHVYERVMPGKNYAQSIKNYWRSYSANCPKAEEKARVFLESFTNTADYPLYRLGSSTASELAKTLENSYRAMNIAFMHEWTLLAEDIGVNLFEVVESVRVRKGTHDNMRYPGFGVGGYCLTKDSMLAQWGARELLGSAATLELTLRALRVNRLMPLHSLDLLEAYFGDLRGRTILLCGVAYIADVADARNSPAEVFCREASKRGAKILAHDAVLEEWHCPGLAENDKDILVKDLETAARKVDAVVLAVNHTEYAKVAWPQIFQKEKINANKKLLLDAWNMIDDETAAKIHAAGTAVIGVGKGHWRKLAYHNK